VQQIYPGTVIILTRLLNPHAGDSARLSGIGNVVTRVIVFLVTSVKPQDLLVFIRLSSSHPYKFNSLKKE
jgi:hypothetical protein